MKLRIIPILFAAFLLFVPLSAAAPSWSDQGQNATYGSMNGGIKLQVKAIPGYDSWNLSRASSTGTNLSTQDLNPTGIFWNPSGNKLYEVGSDSGLFYSYTCSNAWDISSCSYTNTNLLVQDTNPKDLFWKSDGTRLYEVGYGGNLFYDYSCSGAWDLSTCSYTNTNLSTEGSIPQGMFWKGDGSKLYEIDGTGPAFYSYDCSDAWNLSTCSYTGTSLSAQDANPRDLFWKSDGSKLYETGWDGDLFYSYNCSDAWNLSSCSYTNINISTQDSTPQGMFWESDGDKLYEVGSNGDLVYSYTTVLGLDTATLATNETGSYSNQSTKDLGGAKTETWANFSYSLPSKCDKVVGWKQYINGSLGETNTTDVMTFDLYPWLNKTSNSTVVNSIYDCPAVYNVTLQPSNPGDATTEIILKYFQRTGFKECNYGAEGSERITTENLTDYCYATVEYSDVSAGTNYTIKEEKATGGEQPSNLPAAIGAGIVGTLTLVYVIKRWK